MLTPAEKEGLEHLRGYITKQCRLLLVKPATNWHGFLIYGEQEGKLVVATADIDRPGFWVKPEEVGLTFTAEISTMMISLPEDISKINTRPYIGDSATIIGLLADHPYYKGEEIKVKAPVLKKDASEGDKLMAFFFAPKEEKRPKDSPYEFL